MYPPDFRSHPDPTPNNSEDAVGGGVAPRNSVVVPEKWVVATGKLRHGSGCYCPMSLLAGQGQSLHLVSLRNPHSLSLYPAATES